MGYRIVEERECAYRNCNNTFKPKQKKAKFCSEKCKRIESVWLRRKKLKIMAIEYKGGKCEVCGYNKCVDAIDFHHRNPDEKEFGLSTKGLTKSWEKIKKELDKCMILCANCHREIHSSVPE